MYNCDVQLVTILDLEAVPTVLLHVALFWNYHLVNYSKQHAASTLAEFVMQLPIHLTVHQLLVSIQY